MIRETKNRKNAPVLTSDRWHVLRARWKRPARPHREHQQGRERKQRVERQRRAQRQRIAGNEGGGGAEDDLDH
jgi:hypothetical protein